MTGKYLTSNTTFSKKVNPIKYPIQTYILVRIWNLLKKRLTQIIFSNNICSGIKIKQAKKTISHSYQKLDFFQNSSVPFHQVTFDHSISCVLLIDKPNESCKTRKHLKEIPYPPEKAFKKKRKYFTSKDKCPNFTNFFRAPKINNSNLSNEKQRT